jgi:hypothetical protein
MQPAAPSTQPVNRQFHIPSLLQLLVSGVGLLISLTSAVGLFVFGLMGLAGEMDGLDLNPLINLGWTSLAIAVLLVPSIVYAFQRLNGQVKPVLRLRNSFRVASGLLILVPLLLLVGYLLNGSTDLDWLILPPIQVLVVGIPLWWFIEVGRRGLSAGSPQRNWGVLSVGLVVVPTLIILLEVVLLIGLFVVGVVWVSSQPDLVMELERLATRLTTVDLDADQVLRIIGPYLQRPGVIYAVLAIVAGLIPLLEELFKPVAVWGLVSQRIRPADGFVAGMISGAAFAFIESTGVLSTSLGADWVSSVVGRLGTGLLHTLTAGLVGWGIASAIGRGRFGRLALGFTGAVLLHSLWNVFGVLLSFSEGQAGQVVVGGLVQTTADAAPYVLAGLSAIMLLILLGLNRRLQREQVAVE